MSELTALRPAALPWTMEPAYAEGLAWLIHEANLLNRNRLDDWLALLSPQLRYVMPVTATYDAFAPAVPTVPTGNAYYDENYASISVRIKRLQAVTQWAENPPSRARRFITNVELLAADDDGIRLLSSVLLLRSRGDSPTMDVLSAEREDLLVRGEPAARLLLADRVLRVDKENLAVANITSFL